MPHDYDQTIAAQQRTIRALTLDGPARQAFVDAGLHEDDWPLVRDAFRDRFEPDDRGGVVVLNEQGQRTTQALADLVAQHRAAHPRIYGTPLPGGGDPGYEAALALKVRTGAYFL